MKSLEEPQPSPLADCSIALKAANESPEVLERCLGSIDDDVALSVVVTPNPRTIAFFKQRNIPTVVTEYGNIAKSTQMSVDNADTDTVIVMDADTYFTEGSIRRMRHALDTNVIVKPRLDFVAGGGYISDLIARNREPFYADPHFAANPGLGFRKTELAELCGGYIFNPRIRWTEDADLNYRLAQTGTPVHKVESASLLHDSVTLKHELKTAFLYGIGKRLSVENTPGRAPNEEVADIARAVVAGLDPRIMSEKIKQQNIDGYLLDLAWKSLYFAGYHAQKRSQHWAVD